MTATERLLDVHHRVHVALDGVPANPWPLYEPGTFVPHCTLAMGADQAAWILDVVDADLLPTRAVAHELHLVEISTGRSHERLT